MHYISDVLYWISTGLLVPVIILLIYFFCRALLLAGAFFGQYLDRQKVLKKLSPTIDKLSAENIKALSEQLPKKHHSLFVSHLQELLSSSDSTAKMEKVLADFEVAAENNLSISKLLTKMGPMLGLMGTLIPMGPALVGLSSGDIASMAYNMQVAFATTVVGLFSSAVGFVTLQVKQRWFVEEFNDLDFISQLIRENMQ